MQAAGVVSSPVSRILPCKQLKRGTLGKAIYEYHQEWHNWNIQRLLGNRQVFYVYQDGLAHVLGQPRDLQNNEATTLRIDARHIAATGTEFGRSFKWLVAVLIFALLALNTSNVVGDSMTFTATGYFLGFLMLVCFWIFGQGWTKITVYYSGQRLQYWEWGKNDDLIQLAVEIDKVRQAASRELRGDNQDTDT